MKINTVDIDKSVHEAKGKIDAFLIELERDFAHGRVDLSGPAYAGLYGSFISGLVRGLDSDIKIETLQLLKQAGADITMHAARDYLMKCGVPSISNSTAKAFFATPGRKSTGRVGVTINVEAYTEITEAMLEKLASAKDAWKPVKKEYKEKFSELLSSIFKRIS